MTTIFLHDYLQKINEFLDSDRVREAAAHCRHILQQYPRHLGTYRALAQALLEQGEYADAIDLFHRVLSAEPSDFISHLGLSIIYQEQSELASAIWHMERAYEMKPYDAVVQEKLKQLYRQNAIPSPGRLSLTKGALARLYLRGDLYQQAATEFRQLLSQEEDRVDIELLLAETLWRDGQRVEAVELCRKVLKKLPNCINAQAILADVWFATGRTVEAEEYVQRLQELTLMDANHIESETPLAHAFRANGQVKLPDAIEVAMLEDLSAPAAEEEIQADWVDDASFGDELAFIDEPVGAEGVQESEGMFSWLRDDALPEDALSGDQESDEEELGMPMSGTSIPMAESMWLVDEESAAADEIDAADDEEDWLMGLDDAADSQQADLVDVFADLHGEASQDIDISPWDTADSAGDADRDLTDWLNSDQPDAQSEGVSPEMMESDWFGASSFHDRVKTGDETTLLNEDSEWLAILDDMESQSQQLEEESEPPMDSVPEDVQVVDIPEPSGEADEDESSPEEEAEPLSEWLMAQIDDADQQDGQAETDPTDDLPDWMHTGMFESESDTAGKTQILAVDEPHVFSTSADAPMPEWLQSEDSPAEDEVDVADLMADAPELTLDSSLEGNIPDWMLEEMGADEAPAGFSALLGNVADEQAKPSGFGHQDDQADDQGSELPDWLAGDVADIDSGGELEIGPQDEDELPAWLADEQSRDAQEDDFGDEIWDSAVPSPESAPMDEIPDWLVGDDAEDESEPRLAEQRLENIDVRFSEPTDELGSDASVMGDDLGFEDDAELLLEWDDEDDLEDSVDDAEQQEDDMSEWLFSDDLESRSEESEESDESLDQIDSPLGEFPVEAELDWLVADDLPSGDGLESSLEPESENELHPAADEIPDWLKTGQFDLDSEGELPLESLQFDAEIPAEEEGEFGRLDIDLEPENALGDDDAGFGDSQPASEELLEWLPGDDLDEHMVPEDAELMESAEEDLISDAEARFMVDDDLPDWLSSGAFEADDAPKSAGGDTEVAALDLSQELGLSAADETDDLLDDDGLAVEMVGDALDSDWHAEKSATIVWPSVPELEGQDAGSSEAHRDDEIEAEALGTSSDGSPAELDDMDSADAAVDSSWRDLVDDVTDELPEDLDDAMAWIEELAANKEAPVEELPTIARAIESEEEGIVQAEADIETPQPVEEAADAEEDSYAEMFEDSDFEFESDAIDIDGMLEQMPSTDSEFDLDVDFEAILDAHGAEDDDDFLSELTQMSTDSDIDLSWADADDLSEETEVATEPSAAAGDQILEQSVDEEIDAAAVSESAHDAAAWLDQSAEDEIVPVHELPTVPTAPPAERMEASDEPVSLDPLPESQEEDEDELPFELDETEEEFEEAIAWLDEMSEDTVVEDQVADEGGEEGALEAALAEMFTNSARESVDAAELQEALDWLTQLAEQEGTPISESPGQEAGPLEIADDELQEALDWLEKLAWEQESKDGGLETLPDLGLSVSYGKPGVDDSLADLLDESDEADGDMLWIEKDTAASGLSFSDTVDSDGTSELIEALESVGPAVSEPMITDGDAALDFDAELMAGLPSDADSSPVWEDKVEDLLEDETDSLLPAEEQLSVAEADELALPIEEPSEQADPPAELKIKPTFGADDDAMFELSVGVSEGVLEGGFLDDLPEDADAALAWLEQFVEPDQKIEDDSKDVGETLAAVQPAPADVGTEEGEVVDSDETVDTIDAPVLDIKPTFGADDDAMFELSVGVSEGILEGGFLDDLPEDADAALEWLEQFVETDQEVEAGTTDVGAAMDAGAEEVATVENVETAETLDAPTLDIKPTFGADDDAMFELSVGMSEGVLEEGFLEDVPEDPEAALEWLESFIDDDQLAQEGFDQPEDAQDAVESPRAEMKRSKVADLAREILGEMGEELDADLLEKIPDDPDEAVAWLQQFVVDEPESEDDLESEILGFDGEAIGESSLDDSFLDNMPEDPDDAMSWLESISDENDLLGVDSEDSLPDVTELLLDSEVDVDAILAGESDESDLERYSDLGELLGDDVTAPNLGKDAQEINLESGVSDSMPDWLSFERDQEGASAKTEEWLQSLPEPDVAGWLEGEEAATVSGVYDFNASLTQEEVRFGTGQLPSLDPIPGREEPRPAAADKRQPLEAGTALKDQDRLALARKAMADGQFKEAAAHYGVMVENEDDLALLIDELKRAVAEHGPQSPLWRVLGDAYMGNGQLQEALDAYRLTLDQM